MLRSEINKAYLAANSCFAVNNWKLPPNPKWDITDFGLGNFNSFGLVLINLAQEPEYCEKLMFAKENQETPMHYHKAKKEDIICRNGKLGLLLFAKGYDVQHPKMINIKLNGEIKSYKEGSQLILNEGERITIEPLVWHSFKPIDGACIIGEISTFNDDANDNFFENPEVGRYPEITEDEPPLVTLLSEK
ncbi:MAG TPA: D-lyxose/D-mannose family sugar isomerase [Pelobium sp.]